MVQKNLKITFIGICLALASCAPKKDDSAPLAQLKCNDVSQALSSGQIPLTQEVSCICSEEDYTLATGKDVFGDGSYHFTSDICAGARHRNLLEVDKETTISILPGKQCSYFQASSNGGVTSKEKDLSGAENSFFYKTEGAEGTVPECNQKPAPVTCLAGTAKTWINDGKECSGTIETLGNSGEVATIVDSEGRFGSARYVCQSGSWEIDSSFISSCASATETPGTDSTAPTLLTKSPGHQVTNVALGANIILMFSETIKAGTGEIQILKLSDHSVVKTMSVTDTNQVTFLHNAVTLNPSSNLSLLTEYYLKIPAAAILDLSNNSFSGLLTSSDYQFKTRPEGDTAAPTLASVLPANNSTNVAVNSNLVLTFNEKIKVGTGVIGIYKKASGTSSLVQSISITDTTQVSISDKVLTVNPTSNLLNGTLYFIKLASGVIKDLSNNNYAGLNSDSAYDFTTIAADVVAPTLVSSLPADGTTGIAIGSNIQLTFSENIKAGSGYIEIHRADNKALVQYASVTDSSVVTIDGKVLTYNPGANLNYDTSYFVIVAQGVVKDVNNVSFAGILTATSLNFKTLLADVAAPLLESTLPADNAINVPHSSNLVLKFSENIKANSGNLEIYRSSDNTLAKVISITDESQVSISGKILTINPVSDFAYGTEYYVRVAPGVIKDLSNNSYAGLLTKTSYSFKISATDIVPPTLVTLAPADNATHIAVNSNIVINFSENIKLQTGFIQIYRTSDNSLVVALTKANTAQVSVTGKTLTINPSVNLSANTGYYIKIEAGVVKDLADNNFSGFLVKTDYNFTTAAQ